MSVVISLRRHIDAWATEAQEVPRSPYGEILVAIADAAAEATPHVGDRLQQKLYGLNDRLGAAPTASRLREVHREAGDEIAEWGESASGYLRDKTKEVREIMLAVANAAASATERDQRYVGRFQELTARLQSIARLEDLTTVRRSLVESASELRWCTEKMASEGAAAISQLTAEVSAYRAKLEESERRETLDVLTNLLNRRGIEMRIEERILAGSVFSLIIMDLNGFKAINDRHGHIAGDELLRQFGAELQTQFQPAGIVGRWGGDEFVAIVPAGLGEAQARMETVRKWAFGDYRIKMQDAPLAVTITAAAGLAEWNGRETSLELLARADERMYADKRATGKIVPVR